MNDLSPAQVTIDTITMPLFVEKEVNVAVLRLDKIHPVISGNKWFKLKYYIDEAIQQDKNVILTFGGAWSNHIIATAAACAMKGLRSVGIIRGEEPATLSPTLQEAHRLGMQLVFVSREDYTHKIVPSSLSSEQFYIIPEGGYGTKGAEGAATIAGYYEKNIFTHIACAVGTGTMIAGLINASDHEKITGISVMKNNHSLENATRALLIDQQKQFTILHEFHCGGYAKHNDSLLSFMNMFFTLTGVPSDFVYTGKLFYAIYQLIESNFYSRGSRILLVHSGGLQGNNSLRKGTLIF